TRLDGHRGGFRTAASSRPVERPGVATFVLHALRGILSRHAGAGPTPLSLLRLTSVWHSDARLADGARRPGIELRCLRIAGISRFARSDSNRSVGSSLLTRHGTAPRFPAHHHAAGLSHRSAADD